MVRIIIAVIIKTRIYDYILNTDTTGAVTGLGIVLGLLVTGLIVCAVAVFIFFMRRNMVLKSNTEPNGITFLPLLFE